MNKWVKGKFECYGEDTLKYKTFSFPIKKEILKNDKDSKEDITTVCYKKILLIVQDIW